MSNVNVIARIEAETNAAHDALYNSWDSPGKAMKKYKVGSTAYNNAKARFDAEYAKYIELKKTNDARIATLKKEDDAANKKKEADDAAKKVASAKQTVTEAQAVYDLAVSMHDSKEIADAKTNLDNAKAAYTKATGGKSTTDTTTTIASEDTVLSAIDGWTIQNGKVTNTGGPVWMVMWADASGKNAQPYITNSVSDARAQFLKQYGGTPQKIEALKNQLISSGYLKNANGDMALALEDMITAYTYHVAEQRQVYGSTTPGLTFDFAKTKAVGLTGSNGGTVNYTSRGEAKQVLDQYVTDFIGSHATTEEQDNFYKALTKMETQAGNASLTAAEVSLLAANAIRKRLTGTNVDTLLNTATGSQVAMDVHSLQEYASSYGVNMTASEAMKYVAAGLGQQDYVKKQEDRIKSIAIQLHPNLKDHIINGGTVQDIADQYANIKARKLGVQVGVSTADTEVMDAMNSGMSLTDYGRKLQSDPRWWKTQEADTTVNNLIDKMAQTWGLG